MHPHRKLGRLPRAHGNVPHFSQLRRAMQRPPIPAARNWLDGMPANLGMMLNGDDPANPGALVLGDCSIAALHHLRQVWTYNAGGAEITDPDQCVLADYVALCGYQIGNPDTDQGGNLQAILTELPKRGITAASGQDMPLGFVEIDTRLLDDVREVIALGGGAYIGIDIPDAWTEMDVGGVWDVDHGPIAGGHCVLLAGYDADGFDVISWGARYRMTNAGFSRYCDEAYWLADLDWIKRTGQTPGGITLVDLENAMGSLRLAA